MEGLLSLSEGAEQIPSPPLADFSFWYSVGRSGHKRLHRQGGCWVTEADCRETVGLHNLDGVQVDSKCKLGWPAEAPGNAADGLDISSGSESSSSSSARSFHSEHGLEAALADESD